MDVGGPSEARTRERHYEVKATVLRGYISVLRARGELDGLLPRLSPATRALIREPPPSSAWIDPAPADDIMEAVLVRGGTANVRAISKAGIKAGVLPITQNVIHGLLRLFGASPATLYRKCQVTAGTTLRGVAFEYEARSPRSGVMEADIVDATLHMTRFHRFAGTFELFCELCGESPRVADPEIVLRAPWGHRARYHISW